MILMMLMDMLGNIRIVEVVMRRSWTTNTNVYTVIYFKNMAQNGINVDTIRELYHRVDELSAAISPQPSNNGNINAEVRNIFTRNSSTSSRPPEARARQQQAASQVQQDGQPHGVLGEE